MMPVSIELRARSTSSADGGCARSSQARGQRPGFGEIPRRLRVLVEIAHGVGFVAAQDSKTFAKEPTKWMTLSTALMATSALPALSA